MFERKVEISLFILLIFVLVIFLVILLGIVAGKALWALFLLLIIIFIFLLYLCITSSTTEKKELSYRLKEDFTLTTADLERLIRRSNREERKVKTRSRYQYSIRPS